MSETMQAPVAPGAAPSAPEAATKTKRAEYPVPDGGFKEWPLDWDGSEHKMLQRHQFADPAIWLEKKATLAELESQKYRAEAEQIKKFGPPKGASSAKRLQKVQGELSALYAALEKQGVNVAQVKASAGIAG